MKWVFKLGDNFQLNRSSDKSIAVFFQKRNFTGETGEDVLILERKRKNWEFTANYRITNIEVEILEKDIYQISISLVLVELFKDEKLLDDYIYSLRRITNYTNPINHFNRKYSRLKDAEFEAIVKDKIYIKRTVLGTILNAMHSDHQNSFISFLALEAPSLLTGKPDIDKALGLLLEYLDFAVRKQALYLKESENILRRILPEDEINEIEFGDDIENTSSKYFQMLQPQVENINIHLDNLFGFKNNKLGIQFMGLEENPKFNLLFKNVPLPITLK